MSWIEQDFLDFFRELDQNCHREWFQENKKRYEKSVKQPFESLVAELIALVSSEDNRIQMTPKDAIFRIYKDVRFSKDKLPYKDHAGAIIAPNGRKMDGPVGMYFEISDKRLAFASGLYAPDKEALLAVRRALAVDSSGLHKVIKAKQFKQMFGEIQGDKNKVLPAEFKEAAKAEPLIFNKQFYIWAEYPADEALRDDLPQFLMEHWRASRALAKWLDAVSSN
jgi:uncharacterized protein (TIGR02453 family)